MTRTADRARGAMLVESLLPLGYAGRVQRIEFSIPVRNPDDADRLRTILARIREP